MVLKSFMYANVDVPWRKGASKTHVRVFARSNKSDSSPRAIVNYIIIEVGECKILKVEHTVCPRGSRIFVTRESQV